MNRIIKIILHSFYWMVFFLFSGAISFRLTNGPDYILEHWDMYLYNSMWAVIQFYLFYFFVYRLIEQQRYTRYFGISVVVSLVLAAAMILLFLPLFGAPTSINWKEAIPPVIGMFIIGNTGSLLRGFIGWFDDLQRRQEMEKMLIRNELDVLNAQLNPHFLFNTLNNIDSLIFRQPQKASESLITLSEIMRYMLYDAREPKVLFAREVEHYQRIIRLQSLRFANPETIRFDTPAELPEIQIAPLLFLPFIENAFKYAVKTNILPMIEFRMTISEGEICWTSRNCFQAETDEPTARRGGIGLSNLKRRLELLYPERYSLETRTSGNEFFAELKLEL
jgi:two-component system, LytTR family, sensor kinase